MQCRTHRSGLLQFDDTVLQSVYWPEMSEFGDNAEASEGNSTNSNQEKHETVYFV